MLTFHRRPAPMGRDRRHNRRTIRQLPLIRSCGLVTLALLLVPDSAIGSAADLIERPSAPNQLIKELAQQVRMTPGGMRMKLEKNIDQIFSTEHGLGFTYQARPTLTAAEALEARAGNCLSMVNLFISIARSADINAQYMEVEDVESFHRYQDTIVRSTHVIGGVELIGSLMQVDFLPRREKRYRVIKPISDRRAAVLFYNALAAEAMLVRDIELAEQQFAKAFEISDDVAETWNNFAVFLRRRGRIAEATAALERAHRLDARLLPAIENLVGLYRRTGQSEEARRFEALAFKEKTRNPYFLLQESLRHLDQGETSEAEDLLQKARRLKPEEPEIYVALGRVALAKGNEKAAYRLFEEATRKSGSRASGFQSRLQKKIDSLLAQPNEAQ